MGTLISSRHLPFRAFSDEMEQFCNALWGGCAVPEKGRESFVPALNVWEEDEKYIVETELPGVSPKEVDITLEGRELRIRGERKFEKEERKKHVHRQEHAYGSFQRSVRFPTDVNTESVEARSQDGVLRISVNKAETVKPKRIQVVAN